MLEDLIKAVRNDKGITTASASALLKIVETETPDRVAEAWYKFLVAAAGCGTEPAVTGVMTKEDFHTWYEAQPQALKNGLVKNLKAYFQNKPYDKGSQEELKNWRTEILTHQR